MVVLPQEAWEAITKEVKEIKNLFEKRAEEEVKNQWIESSEARKLLGVSQRTWQDYRDKRVLPFSQYGRKIYVKRADVEEFMQRNYIISRRGKNGK